MQNTMQKNIDINGNIRNKSSLNFRNLVLTAFFLDCSRLYRYARTMNKTALFMMPNIATTLSNTFVAPVPDGMFNLSHTEKFKLKQQNQSVLYFIHSTYLW